MTHRPAPPRARRLWRVQLIVLVLVAFGSVMPLPNAGAHAARPHVLVYSGTDGFRHASITRAKDVLARAAAGGRFTLEFTEDPRSLNASRLERADVVLWLSSTGSTSPFSNAQEKAYESWVRCGGGHVGVHASTDSWHDGSWPAWTELTGAFFAGHPITATSAADDSFTNPQGVHPIVHFPAAGVDYVEGDGEPEATIRVADKRHTTTKPWRGKSSFLLRDEYYYFDRNPAKVMDDFNPLLTFGGFTDPTVAAMFGSNYRENMPLAWTGSFRSRNRIFYTNLGHGIATWSKPAFVSHVVAGILWTAAAPTPRGCA